MAQKPRTRMQFHINIAPNLGEKGRLQSKPLLSVVETPTLSEMAAILYTRPEMVFQWLIPNSPRPLLHYKGVLKDDACTPSGVHELFDSNDWRAQWLVRYGPTQTSHYHTEIHECMAVLSGTATIRWGVADLTDDLDKSTWGGAHEEGGVEVEAQAGDVFVIPAGVSHKTHNTSPGGSLELLSPGEGRGIEATNGNVKETLRKIELSGFTMMGAYPKNCGTWDFAIGEEDKGQFERSWKVPRPERDPVLGESSDGICTTWNESEVSRQHDPFAAKM